MLKSYHSILQLCVVSIFLLSLNFAIRAQSGPLGYRVVDLSMPGDLSSEARSINNVGQVVGTVDVDGTADGKRAFIWENGERQFILDNTWMRAEAINDSGWVTGSYRPDVQYQGYLWKDGSLFDLGHLGGYGVGPADINELGQIVGTGSTAAGKVKAFLWENGSMDSLPAPAGWNGITRVKAAAINNNGQIAGDTGFDDGKVHTFIWENNSITMLGLSKAELHDISNDGYVSGTSYDFEAAFRWKDGLMEVVFYGHHAQAWRINDNGQVIAFRDSLWDNGTIHYINDLLDESAQGWSNLSFWDINNQGQIIGTGIHENKQKAMMLDPAAVKVTNPKADELWVVGTKDTISWEALSDINSVDIWYSADSGTAFTQIEANYPADSGYYVWQVPDELSQKCIIQVHASNNENRKGESPLFHIKDYEMTRISNDDYEAFLPQEDGWNFGNTFGNMWPQSWWQQFDYYNGDDPYTNQPYPDEWIGPDVYASPPVFPSWPAYVRAFGTEQLYFSLHQGIYRPSAVQKWKIHHSGGTDTWGGSCSGFAISSIQAFNDIDVFSTAYPDIPLFFDLHDVALAGPPRALLNQLWIHWRGQQHKQFQLTQRNKTPRQTVRELVDMFMDDSDDDQYLYIASATGAHAVVPYRVLPYPSDSVAIFIYDSNNPNDTQRFIIADTVANTWRYKQRPSYSGTNKMYLMDPVSSYYQRPILQNGNSGPEQIAADYVEINVTTGANIWISDENGNQAGYVDGANFNQITDALLLIPPTGFDSPPEGYYLPGDSYSITMNNFTDSTSYLTIVEDSIIYSVSRQSTDAGENDKLIYEDGLTIYNPDGVSKTIYQETILINPENERVFDIFDVTLSEGDSLQFRKMDDDEIVVRNAGTAKMYNLKVKQASAQQEEQFLYANLALDANSTQYIQPDWSDLLNAPLTILIDEGSDGTIDDSMAIVHQPVGVENEPENAVVPVAFRLYQNFPNPFNPVTTIRYDLPERSPVKLAVYNLLGQLVTTLVDDTQAAGVHTVQWDGSKWGSGVYFLQLESNGFRETRKMLLLR